MIMNTATCSVCSGEIWLADDLADYIVNGEVVCSKGCLEERGTL